MTRFEFQWSHLLQFKWFLAVKAALYLGVQNLCRRNFWANKTFIFPFVNNDIPYQNSLWEHFKKIIKCMLADSVRVQCLLRGMAVVATGDSISDIWTAPYELLIRLAHMASRIAVLSLEFVFVLSALFWNFLFQKDPKRMALRLIQWSCVISGHSVTIIYLIDFKVGTLIYINSRPVFKFHEFPKINEKGRHNCNNLITYFLDYKLPL